MAENVFYASKDDKISEREIRHAELARRLAGECMVLLENDGVLPLKKKGKLAVYGNGVRRTVRGGAGSGSVNTRSITNIEQGMEEAGFTVENKDWLNANDRNYEEAQSAYNKFVKEEEEKGIPAVLTGFNYPFEEPDCILVTDKDIDECGAETVLYVISRNSGEGADRKNRKGDYLLSDNELANIKLLAKSGKKLIIVLNIGGVMQLTELKEIKEINAIVLMSQLGNLGGNALADLLTGEVVPSGKLSDTWAEAYGDYPSSAEFSHNNGNVDDEYYKDGIYVGYRYFDSFKVKPLYSFGYGLSYTDFEINTEEVKQAGEHIQVIVNVKNTGSIFAGKEVVQVYVSKPQGGLNNPYKELAAFAKTEKLVPGQDCSLTISFPLRNMASYREKEAAYVLEAGNYVVRIGNCSDNAKAVAGFRVEKEVMTEKCENLFPLDCELKEIKADISDSEEDVRWNFTVDTGVIPCRINEYLKERPELHTQTEKNITMQDVKDGSYTIEELVAQLTVEEMAELCVGTERRNSNSIIGMASYSVPGAAGDTSSVLKESRGVKNMIMADGPAGLRLQPHFKTDKDGNVLQGGEVFNDFVFPFENVPEGAVDYYQYCTAIPIGWALAQSWDTVLVEEIGDMIGKEMEEFNVDLWLAPALNIHRNPLCGRNFEYYSEDPLLSGKIAAAMTRGVQKNQGKGVTIKHFAANNQEENRYFINAHVSERTLREIYLKGFEIAVKEARPISIMSSYNLLNGIHTANSYDLLQKAARDEWQYDGFIMTDWYTSQDVGMMTGKYKANYPISSSVGCIYAGNDIQMPGCQQNIDDIVEAVKGGTEKDGYKITLADLQFNVMNILRTILKTI